MTSLTTNYSQLANNIRKYRKIKGLTQNELCDLLDISREHLAKVETMRRKPSLDLLFRIAIALDIEVKYLFD